MNNDVVQSANTKCLLAFVKRIVCEREIKASRIIRGFRSLFSVGCQNDEKNLTVVLARGHSERPGARPVIMMNRLCSGSSLSNGGRSFFLCPVTLPNTTLSFYLIIQVRISVAAYRLVHIWLFRLEHDKDKGDLQCTDCTGSKNRSQQMYL